jgi:hypothetical protein
VEDVMSDHLVQEIVRRAADEEALITFQPVQLGLEDAENELLLFVKPEIFLAHSHSGMEAALDLIFDRLAAFSARSDGIVLLGGRVLEEKEIMNRHYGYINQLSRQASQMVTAEDRDKMEQLLGFRLPAHVSILGGHEYLAAHPTQQIADLDLIWFSKKSLKLRSGFYIQYYDLPDGPLVLVNGFHPGQLRHFTDPTHRILLFLLHSNTPWKVLRDEMVGNTFPEKALSTSMRGALYADPARYGLDKVEISCNGVHLSAGPFEALFELQNFFGRALDFDLLQTPPLLFKRLLAAGLSPQQAQAALLNPSLTLGGRSVDLFTATEDVDSEAALALALPVLRLQAGV